jgi:hypothetical protein
MIKKSFENVAKTKCLGMRVTKQIWFMRILWAAYIWVMLATNQVRISLLTCGPET